MPPKKTIKRNVAFGTAETPDDVQSTATEFRIMPIGEFRGQHWGGPVEKFTLTPENAAKIVAHWKARGRDIQVDYDHDSLSNPKAPAAGWVSGLDARADGLYATGVSWTEDATKLLDAREKRFHSPVFIADDKGNVTELLNIALTNDPAMHDLVPIAATAAAPPAPVPSTPEKKPMITLMKALGLTESATEAEAFVALSTRLDGERQLMTLTGQKSVSEALGHVAGLVEKGKQYDALAAHVQEQEQAVRTEKIEAAYKAAKDGGKITPATEQTFRATMPAASPEQLVALFNALPVLANFQPLPGAQPAEASATTKRFEEMTGAEKHRLANDDPATYRALKRDHVKRMSAALPHPIPTRRRPTR